MNSSDAGSRNRERLADLLRQELSETDARPSIHRWSRRRDQRVIPIELAAVGGNAPVEEKAGDATENSVVAERQAAESRAHDLELVVIGLRHRLKELEATVQAVTHRAARAESAARTVSSSATALPSTGDARLYGQVGLTPGCPDFLLEAARRAYLREYHPDRHQGAQAKESATADFQFYSRVFRVIEDERAKLRARTAERR
jgi:hypothetical protein